MTFQYTDLVSKQHLLKQKYELTKNKNINSDFTGKIQPVTTLAQSDNFELPVVIKGRLVSSGIYKDSKFGSTFIPWDELKRIHHSWVGKKIFKFHDAYWGRKLDPNTIPIDSVVGTITQTSLNEQEKGVDFIANIFDRDVAYKIYSGLINSISGGFTNDVVFVSGMAHKINISPEEATLVLNPADKNASNVHVVDIKYN